VGILRLGSVPLRFRGMIGTGGIGHGTFFQLDGNQTLGREESRGGRFLERRDYCKLHIISHYVKALLGNDFAVIPLGKVGDDDAGARLLTEMEVAGLDTRFVQRDAGSPTLYSFCFLYPDGTGGNLTTADSASARVEAAWIQAAEPSFAELAGKGIALAAPEVPLAARETLLEMGTRHAFFRAASFTSAEMGAVRDAGLLEMVDLLAVNLEEALASAGIASVRTSTETPADLAKKAVETLFRTYPRLLLSITAGASGSWAWDGQILSHEPALPVKAQGTAGAGDAHLAGMLSGLAAGLDLPRALRLATLVAAASVTSPHAINGELSRDMLITLPGGPAKGADGVSALLDN
jgi:ribokinase